MNPAPKTPDTGLDRWLKTPWRRMLLVTGAVVVAAAVSGWQLYDARVEMVETMLSETGRTPSRSPDFWAIFRFQLMSWGLWGVAFEPILLFARLVSRVLPHWLPVLLVHVPVSYFVSDGVLEAEQYLGLNYFQPERNEAEFRPPRGGGQNRDERPLSDRPVPDSNAPRDPQTRPPRREQRPEGRGPTRDAEDGRAAVAPVGGGSTT